MRFKELEQCQMRLLSTRKLINEEAKHMNNANEHAKHKNNANELAKHKDNDK